MIEKLNGLSVRKIEDVYNETRKLDLEENTQKRTLLLHSCCGPCSTACIDRLIGNYDITVFYYNPNITDVEEYERRKQTQISFIEKYNETVDDGNKIKFIEGEYVPLDYYNFIKGLENEKEGGKRCEECFKLRLNRTAQVAKELDFQMFTTTLTVSPHKNSQLISLIGNTIAGEYGVEYLDIDFKKKDGFKKSIDMSKEYNLYRQNYCGCEFSKWFDK